MRIDLTFQCFQFGFDFFSFYRFEFFLDENISACHFYGNAHTYGQYKRNHVPKKKSEEGLYGSFWRRRKPVDVDIIMSDGKKDKRDTCD